MKKPVYHCHSLDPVQDLSKKPMEPMNESDHLEMHTLGKSVFSLALPVMLQSLISAAVNYADVLMLSCINQNAMSAVSQANQITFLLTLFYLGLSSGVTILTAQYWGVRNLRAIEQILGLSIRLSMLISAAFSVAALFVPHWLMRIYTPDTELIGYGIPYLRIVGISYLFTGLSQMLHASIKSMEKTVISSFISSSSLLCNILLNAVAVFILFSDNPYMAVVGVAWATTAARILEVICCILWLRRSGVVQLRLRDIAKAENWLKRDFWNCIWRVQLNYIIWGGALSVTTALIGYVSSDMVSAYAVVNSVRNLAIVACTGVSAAGSILLGKYLGAGRLALAKAAGDRIKLWSVLFGAFSGILILLVRPLCLQMVTLNTKASDLLNAMLLISSYYCIGKSYNSTLVGGIFCAGGDTKFGLICDTVTMWGVILPAAWICAFVLKWEPVWIFFVLCLDEFVKMPFVASHYRKYKWLNNLTRNINEEDNIL